MQEDRSRYVMTQKTKRLDRIYYTDIYDLIKKRREYFGQEEEVEKEEEERDVYSQILKTREEILAKPTEIPELPEIEEKEPPFLQKIKSFGEKLLPSILGPQRYADVILAPQLERAKKEALMKAPEKPEMRALTPEEEIISERGPEYLARAAEMPRYPKTEELEYGELERLLDIPGQFLTQFAKMFAWGLPEFIPGEEPAPKSEVAEAAGAVGHLLGLIGPGSAYAPFKVMATVSISSGVAFIPLSLLKTFSTFFLSKSPKR
ncbi:hypothetical protein ES703_110599 [subsurface metagenome]